MLLGPGAAAAGNFQQAVEEQPADFFDGGRAVGDDTGVDVHEVEPAPRQFAARGDLDDRAGGQAVGRAAAGGENMQVHAGGELQGAADEVAGGGGGKDQAALAGRQFFAQCDAPHPTPNSTGRRPIHTCTSPIDDARFLAARPNGRDATGIEFSRGGVRPQRHLTQSGYGRRMTPLPPPPFEGAYFFDFDGTLVDIADQPEAVQVQPCVAQALLSLQRGCAGALAVVSGRPVAQIDQHLHPALLAAAGQHGAERRRADGSWERIAPPDLAAVLPPLQALVQAHPALILEVKSAALALHYRRAPSLAADCLAAMQAAQAGVPATVLLKGKMVIELKSTLADKGRALQAFMTEAPFCGREPWFFGDDVTDEAGFEAVQRLGGVAVKVGAGASVARFRLPDPAAVRAWLLERTR